MSTPTNRADPFAGDLDLSDFQPAAPRRAAVQKAAIREVSEANNFPSRAPVKAKAAATQQRRRRTGRNMQFNIKASAETIERFTKLADQQGWVFGEAFEHAVAALENSLPNP